MNERSTSKINLNTKRKKRRKSKLTIYRRLVRYTFSKFQVPGKKQEEKHELKTLVFL